MLQTRLNMELAALGTPDMLLTKVRVPRQAATAAKAAIKKDLLQQNSRPNAAELLLLRQLLLQHPRQHHLQLCEQLPPWSLWGVHTHQQRHALSLTSPAGLTAQTLLQLRVLCTRQYFQV